MILINEASHPLLALVALSAGLLLSESLFARANKMCDDRDDFDDVIADPRSYAASNRASTQKIRRRLIADQSLSTNAHDVTISMTNAEVTLKGRLNSEDERQQMASSATEVVDASKVEHQLTAKRQNRSLAEAAAKQKLWKTRTKPFMRGIATSPPLRQPLQELSCVPQNLRCPTAEEAASHSRNDEVQPFA